MKTLRYLFIVLLGTTAVFSMGCSYVTSMVQTIENKMSPSHSERGAEILADAKEAQKSGDYAQAESYYLEYVGKSKLQNNPVDLGFAYSQLGELALRKNQFEGSNRYFEESIKHNPSDLEVYGKYGESLFRLQGNYVGAEALFRQAMTLSPNDPRFQLQLGRTLAYQKKYQAGLGYLKTALGEQQAYDEIAKIYHQHGEYERAALAMTKAHESQNKQQLAQNGINQNRPVTEMGQTNRSPVLPEGQQTYAMPSSGQQALAINSNDGFASSQSQSVPINNVQQPMPNMIQQQPIVPAQTMPPQQTQPQQVPIQQVLVQQPIVPQSQPVMQQQYGTLPTAYTAQVPHPNTMPQQPETQYNNIVPQTPPFTGYPPNNPHPTQTYSPYGQSQPVPQPMLGTPISSLPPQNTVQNVAITAPINPLSPQAANASYTDNGTPTMSPVFNLQTF